MILFHSFIKIVPHMFIARMNNSFSVYDFLKHSLVSSFPSENNMKNSYFLIWMSNLETLFWNATVSVHMIDFISNFRPFQILWIGLKLSVINEKYDFWNLSKFTLPFWSIIIFMIALRSSILSDWNSYLIYLMFWRYFIWLLPKYQI